MLPEQITYLAIPISLFFSFFYIRDIILGKFKPNLVTWFLWALAPLIAVFLQLKEGAGLSVLPVFLAGFFPAIIFGVALFKRNAYWRITKFDIFCGIFSLIALICWVVTKRADVSLIFALLSDFFAAIPTIVKAYKFPDTESATGYVPGIINNTLGLLTVTNWTFSIYSFSVYFITLNTILIFFIIRKKLLESISKLFSNNTIS
jgi:hypothetical protein